MSPDGFTVALLVTSLIALRMEAVMSIPSRLSNYLDQRGARYETCVHKPSRTSAETARVAQVLPHQLAKSVIVEDDEGCVMAVVPADKTVMLGHPCRLLGRKELRLSDETRIAILFEDCDRGAVPPVGMAWGALRPSSTASSRPTISSTWTAAIMSASCGCRTNSSTS